MEIRSKKEVVREIEKSRGELPKAWEIVRIQNPISIGARTLSALFERWKQKGAQTSQSADRQLRVSPYRYMGIALIAGAVVALASRTLRARRRVSA